MLKLLIVDDAPFIREIVKQAVVGSAIELVGEASDGEEAVAMAKSKNPDYTQVSAYLPSSLYKKTKIKSLGNDMEFSELLEILLTKWTEDKITI